MTGMKDTNPKDAVGVQKWRQFAVVPMQVIWEVGVAMLEGALKYGRHNYRASGVRASVYVDAAIGHIEAWFEGQDLDPDTGLSHITKAIASLAVLRDAEMNNFLEDDRPPKVDVEAHAARLQGIVDQMFTKHADKNPHHYTHAKDGAPYLSTDRLISTPDLKIGNTYQVALLASGKPPAGTGGVWLVTRRKDSESTYGVRGLPAEDRGLFAETRLQNTVKWKLLRSEDPSYQTALYGGAYGHPEKWPYVELKLTDGSTTISKWGTPNQTTLVKPKPGFLKGEGDTSLIDMEDVAGWKPA